MQSHREGPRFRRRKLLRVTALGGAGAFLAACALPPGVTPSTTSATSPSPQPRRGGSLRVGVPTDVPTLDGHNSSGFNTLWNVFDFLGVEDDKLNLQPMLAEHFDLSADARQLKASLRHGVQFHTGRELTS